MFRIEFAAGPSCAMVVHSVTPVVLNCPSLIKLSFASAPLAKRIVDMAGNSFLLRMRLRITSEYVEGSLCAKSHQIISLIILQSKSIYFVN